MKEAMPCRQRRRPRASPHLEREVEDQAVARRPQPALADHVFQAAARQELRHDAEATLGSGAWARKKREPEKGRGGVRV